MKRLALILLTLTACKSEAPSTTVEEKIEAYFGANCIRQWTTPHSFLFVCENGQTCEPWQAGPAPDCVTTR